MCDRTAFPFDVVLVTHIGIIASVILSIGYWTWDMDNYWYQFQKKNCWSLSDVQEVWQISVQKSVSEIVERPKIVRR